MFQMLRRDGSPTVKMSAFEKRFEDLFHHRRRIGHAGDVEGRLVNIRESIGQRIAERIEEVIIDLHEDRLAGLRAETVLDDHFPRHIASLARRNHVAVRIENRRSTAESVFQIGEMFFDRLA